MTTQIEIGQTYISNIGRVVTVTAMKVRADGALMVWVDIDGQAGQIPAVDFRREFNLFS